jgi:hypothetical protein
MPLEAIAPWLRASEEVEIARLLRVELGSAQLTRNRMCVGVLRPVVWIRCNGGTSLVTLGSVLTTSSCDGHGLRSAVVGGSGIRGIRVVRHSATLEKEIGGLRAESTYSETSERRLSNFTA